MANALTSSPPSSEQLELFVVNGMALESFRQDECAADVVQALDVTALEPSSAALHAPPRPVDDRPLREQDSSQESTDVRSVLAHYSRRLDRRVLHPMLRAASRDAGMRVLRSEWVWYLRTSSTMADLYREWTDEEARQRAANVAQQQIVRGAQLVGDYGEDEITFLLSTFEGAVEVAASIGGEPPASGIVRDRELRGRFAVACHFYSLGLILLRAAPFVSGRTEAGLHLALELVRIGAVHSYAHIREAWELRRAPENEEDWSQVTLDHRLALG